MVKLQYLLMRLITYTLVMGCAHVYSVSQVNSKHLAYSHLLQDPLKQVGQLAHRDAQYMQSAFSIPELLVVDGNG